MAFSTGDASRPQMNITPLIDVLLVLIVIFMFIVCMFPSRGLDAEIPHPAKYARTSESAIVIQLCADSPSEAPRLKINDENVSWNDLKDRLQKIYLSRTERVAFVRGDDDMDFRYVAEVVDLAKSAGVYHVALLTNDRASIR